jgi:hypothetical protein
MLDIRPVAHVIGLVVCALGLSMVLPMAIDIAARNGHWPAFLKAGVLTALTGALVAIATGSQATGRLTIQQTFLLTTGVWAALPVFAALPFVFGDPGPLDDRQVSICYEKGPEKSCLVLAECALREVGDQDTAVVHDKPEVERVPNLAQDVPKRCGSEETAELVLDGRDSFGSEAFVVVGELLEPELPNDRVLDSLGDAGSIDVIGEQSEDVE